MKAWSIYNSFSVCSDANFKISRAIVYDKIFTLARVLTPYMSIICGFYYICSHILSEYAVHPLKARASMLTTYHRRVVIGCVIRWILLQMLGKMVVLAPSCTNARHEELVKNPMLEFEAILSYLSKRQIIKPSSPVLEYLQIHPVFSRQLRLCNFMREGTLEQNYFLGSWT